MKSFFYFLVVFFTICFVSNGSAQGLNVDSLKLLLNNEKNDSAKVVLFTDVSWEYCYSNTDSALFYAEKGVELANSIGNLFCQSKAISQRATSYYVRSQLDLALADYQIGLKLDEELKDSVGISVDLLSIGNLYSGLNKEDQALEYYQQAYDISELLKDTLSMADVLGNMGAIYIQKQEYEKGLEVLLKSLEHIVDEAGKGVSYQNIGVIYMKMGDYKKSSKNYKLALTIFEESGDKLKVANICTAIASNLILLENPEEAIIYAKKSLRLAKEIGSMEIVQRAYFKLSEAYAMLRNYSKAYGYRLEYAATHDSIFNENSDKAIAEMETKYQTEKKEKENEILSQKNAIQNLENENQKKEINQQNTIIVSTAVGILFLLGLAGLLIRSVRIKKAANIQINKQKDEIEFQRDEITEINSELMASIEYAKNLQDAIIPKADEISKGIASHFVFWLPRDIVSGDFYWYHKEGTDVYIAAADCTGHGVPGAFVSMACHNVLNQVVIDRHYKDPGIILQQVNNGIQKIFKKQGAIAQAHDGMDIAFTKIDTVNNKVTFSGAMNPLIIIRKGEVLELRADRSPIGGSAEVDKVYNEQIIEVEKGDWLYMFSDGYQDQFGGKRGKKYKGKNFRKLLSEIAVSKPQTQYDKLGEEFESWKGSFEQIDDVLVIGINLD